jgi:hypothetical protein
MKLIKLLLLLLPFMSFAQNHSERVEKFITHPNVGNDPDYYNQIGQICYIDYSNKKLAYNLYLNTTTFEMGLTISETYWVDSIRAYDPKYELVLSPIFNTNNSGKLVVLSSQDLMVPNKTASVGDIYFEIKGNELYLNFEYIPNRDIPTGKFKLIKAKPEDYDKY